MSSTFKERLRKNYVATSGQKTQDRTHILDAIESKQL